MCTVLLPPGVNPIAVNKIYHIISKTAQRVVTFRECALPFVEVRSVLKRIEIFDGMSLSIRCITKAFAMHLHHFYIQKQHS
jgi:hypothetical protein